jgi:hypothetical protein
MSIKEIVSSNIKFLIFRITSEELLSFNRNHLIFGLFCTWLVGMGRYWDDPGAKFLQHLGIGSIIYIFILSLFLWLIIWPLKPKSWTYWNILTFVSLTSPPAILYAIPVERFFTLETASTLNVWFLAVVAFWRVALLFFYLKRHAQLKVLSIIVAATLPLTLIVTILTFLNLERAIFDLMSGLREQGTANDTAYMVLVALTILSVYLFIPLLLCYITLSIKAFYSSKSARVNINIVN